MTTSTALSRDTRARLVEAATRAFAERGVHNASLLDITRQAGQRNRGAVHYHFGSRVGLLAAVLEQHVDFLGVRERALIEAAALKPGDLDAAIEILVRPTTELAATGWSGRCFLVIVAELIAEDETETMAAVSELLARTGGVEAFDVIDARLPAMPSAVRDERVALMTSFVLRAVADRARALDIEAHDDALPRARRAQLDDEGFITNLVAMAVGMLAAPVPGQRP